ncbi:MAG: 23S rRNA (adenine(2030)-N(6))-methyltransferase RlmJ [Opitutaceae bacterium]|jgi:23S rRNA (adenine2030-N6)-methyltransferase
MKHVFVVQLARSLQRKPKGVLFLDTHAGRGSYDLELARKGDSLAREPEHPAGIGRIWPGPGSSPALVEYLTLVRDFDRGARDKGKPGGSVQSGALEPRYYPGSPRLLKLLARDSDRLALCETHPEDFQALRSEFEFARRVSVHEMDGYTALRAMLPPPERRALVLIDPSYEAQDETSLVVSALAEALRRFPSGLYAIWYPITERILPRDFLREVSGLSLPPALALELVVEPGAAGLKGCGLLILNPPWRFEEDAKPVLAELTEMMGRSSGAAWQVRWLAPDT